MLAKRKERIIGKRENAKERAENEVWIGKRVEKSK
jgi:hypothetical protein